VLIGACDLLLAERLHALVIAAILGKPLVALVYDVKVEEMIAGLGMEEYAVNINRPFDPQELQRRIEAARANAPVVQAHLRARSGAFRAELAAYFGRLLEGVARRR
jgi:polysaccharide pyruvyl transferase WcaK-like protein